MTRKIKFKLVAFNMADHEIELFSSESYEAVESFAVSYEGEHKEVSIKKVYVREGGSHYNHNQQGQQL